MKKKVTRFAIYNKYGERMWQFPTYGDVITASIALERFQERHPDAGLDIRDIVVERPTII